MTAPTHDTYARPDGVFYGKKSALTTFFVRHINRRAKDYLEGVTHDADGMSEKEMEHVRDKFHVPDGVKSEDVILYIGARAAYYPEGSPEEVVSIVANLKEVGVRLEVPELVRRTTIAHTDTIAVLPARRTGDGGKKSEQGHVPRKPWIQKKIS